MDNFILKQKIIKQIAVSKGLVKNRWSKEKTTEKVSELLDQMKECMKYGDAIGYRTYGVISAIVAVSAMESENDIGFVVDSIVSDMFVGNTQKERFDSIFEAASLGAAQLMRVKKLEDGIFYIRASMCDEYKIEDTILESMKSAKVASILFGTRDDKEYRDMLDSIVNVFKAGCEKLDEETARMNKVIVDNALTDDDLGYSDRCIVIVGLMIAMNNRLGARFDISKFSDDVKVIIDGWDISEMIKRSEDDEPFPSGNQLDIDGVDLPFGEDDMEFLEKLLGRLDD